MDPQIIVICIMTRTHHGFLNYGVTARQIIASRIRNIFSYESVHHCVMDSLIIASWILNHLVIFESLSHGFSNPLILDCQNIEFWIRRALHSGSSKFCITDPHNIYYGFSKFGIMGSQIVGILESWNYKSAAYLITDYQDIKCWIVNSLSSRSCNHWVMAAPTI